jgi:hypothetical protein
MRFLLELGLPGPWLAMSPSDVSKFWPSASSTRLSDTHVEDARLDLCIGVITVG